MIKTFIKIFIFCILCLGSLIYYQTTYSIKGIETRDDPVKMEWEYNMEIKLQKFHPKMTNSELKEFVETMYYLYATDNSFKDDGIELTIAFALTESSFNSKAVGKAGERGLFQLMWYTAKETSDKIYGLKYKRGMEFNPSISLILWWNHLKEIKQHFMDNDLVFLAYNCGIKNVKDFLLYNYNKEQIRYWVYYRKGWKPYDIKIKSNLKRVYNENYI